MTDENFPPAEFIAISACEICYHLADVEFSFVKYAHEEDTELLPAAAEKLVRLDSSQVSDQDRRQFRRCPICGTFYLYKFTYEYLATGSEDEEELTRATPTEARRFLSDEAYTGLIEWMTINLQHPDAMTRFFSAKCLVAHHLEGREMAAISQNLKHPDVEVVKGGLTFLVQFVRDRFKLETCLWDIEDTLAHLSSHSEELVAKYARYLVRNINRYAEPAGSYTETN